MFLFYKKRTNSIVCLVLRLDISQVWYLWNILPTERPWGRGKSNIQLAIFFTSFLSKDFSWDSCGTLHQNIYKPSQANSKRRTISVQRLARIFCTLHIDTTHISCYLYKNTRTWKTPITFVTLTTRHSWHSMLTTCSRISCNLNLFQLFYFPEEYLTNLS